MAAKTIFFTLRNRPLILIYANYLKTARLLFFFFLLQHVQRYVSDIETITKYDYETFYAF